MSMFEFDFFFFYRESVEFSFKLVKYWDESPHTKLQIVSFTVWLIILPH